MQNKLKQITYIPQYRNIFLNNDNLGVWAILIQFLVMFFGILCVRGGLSCGTC